MPLYTYKNIDLDRLTPELMTLVVNVIVNKEFTDLTVVTGVEKLPGKVRLVIKGEGDIPKKYRHYVYIHDEQLTVTHEIDGEEQPIEKGMIAFLEPKLWDELVKGPEFQKIKAYEVNSEGRRTFHEFVTTVLIRNYYVPSMNEVMDFNSFGAGIIKVRNVITATDGGYGLVSIIEFDWIEGDGQPKNGKSPNWGKKKKGKKKEDIETKPSSLND